MCWVQCHMPGDASTVGNDYTHLKLLKLYHTHTPVLTLRTLKTTLVCSRHPVQVWSMGWSVFAGTTRKNTSGWEGLQRASATRRVREAAAAPAGGVLPSKSSESRTPRLPTKTYWDRTDSSKEAVSNAENESRTTQRCRYDVPHRFIPR